MEEYISLNVIIEMLAKIEHMEKQPISHTITILANSHIAVKVIIFMLHIIREDSCPLKAL